VTKIRIAGTGSYLPEDVIHNRDLEKTLDTTDEWIRKRTGVIERRQAAPDQATSDLAKEASLRALDEAGMTPQDVDLMIVATITPDTHCPAAANWLQAKLDAPRAMTFDVTAACSGFIFGLHVAQQYLISGAAKNVLVAASEVMTRVQDWTDRANCILWGDGAGAAVLTTGDGPHQLLSCHIHTDGAGGDDLLMPGGGSATTPITHESVDAKKHSLKMINASASVRVAVTRFAESCLEATEANGIDIQDVDVIVPHQANLRMLQMVAQRLGVGEDKLHLTVHKYGNISSASCAIALDEAVREGRVQDGGYIVLTAFGGGLTWGSALIKW
jgi:3-oxoacyl-[acyl-carrier-protein] synthase-3